MGRLARYHNIMGKETGEKETKLELLSPPPSQEVAGRDERARINDDESPKALEMRQDDVIEV